PLRIALWNGAPNDLFAEDGFAVDNRGDFAIAAAQIKTDAAAVQVAAERGGGFAGGRNIFRKDNFERLFVNTVPHNVGVELAGAAFFVMALELGVELRRAVEINSITAAGPEKKLQEALQINEIS